MWSGSAFRKEQAGLMQLCDVASPLRYPPTWPCARQLQLASHKRKQTSAAPQDRCFSTPQKSVPAADRSYLSRLIEWIHPHIIGSRSLSISVCHTGYWAQGCSSYPASLRPWVFLLSVLATFWYKSLWAQSSLRCVLMKLLHIEST